MLASLAIPGVVHGCSSPTSPPPPPGGGQQLTLDYAMFEQTVSPALERRGCSATGDCHGGGIRGSFELSPPTAKNIRFDFDQAVLQVSAAMRDSSPLLTEPLALSEGGTPHSFKPFASVADTDYQAIRGWIMSGVIR